MTLENGSPAIGAWYSARTKNTPFLVIDYDDRTDLILLLYEDGSTEEIDFDRWEQWDPIPTEIPNHMQFAIIHKALDDEDCYLETLDSIVAPLDTAKTKKKRAVFHLKGDALNDSDPYDNLPESPAL